ncbi:MAG: hypothetical protein ACE5I1_14880 [bacterium]
MADKDTDISMPDDDQNIDKPIDQPFLSSIEKRLIKAESAQEIILWTQVRGAIKKQNDESIEQNHRRALEKLQLKYKLGFSIGAFAVGIGLVIGGFSYAGLFIVGAGLYGLAPDFVKSFFKKEYGNNYDEG